MPPTPPPAPVPTTQPPPPPDLLDRCWPAGLELPRPNLIIGGGTEGDGYVEGTYYAGTVTLDADSMSGVPETIVCQVVVHELAHHRQYITYGNLARAEDYLGSISAVEHNADCIAQALGAGPAAGGYGCDSLDDGRLVLAGEMVDRRTPG